MSDANPDREVVLAKLQYDHQLARLGLQGTLWGAWASLIAIVAIAVVQVTTNRYVIQGWAFAGMVAVIVVPISLYGAFIFNRALTVSAKVAAEGGSFSASSETRGRER
jgi:hypothetical protein